MYKTSHSHLVFIAAHLRMLLTYQCSIMMMMMITLLSSSSSSSSSSVWFFGFKRDVHSVHCLASLSTTTVESNVCMHLVGSTDTHQYHHKCGTVHFLLNKMSELQHIHRHNIIAWKEKWVNHILLQPFRRTNIQCFVSVCTRRRIKTKQFFFVMHPLKNVLL